MFEKILTTEKAQSMKIMEKAIIVKDFFENPVNAFIVANANGAPTSTIDSKSE